MQLLLTWTGLQSLHQEKGALSLSLAPQAHSGGPGGTACQMEEESPPQALNPIQPQARRGQISPRYKYKGQYTAPFGLLLLQPSRLLTCSAPGVCNLRSPQGK